MTHDPAGEVFAALADPTRRRVVRELSADGPLTATQLAERIPVSRQAIAKHVTALEEAGLAVGTRVGRERRYELRTDPFADAEAWMRAIGASWDRRLQAFTTFLEADGSATADTTTRPTRPSERRRR